MTSASTIKDTPYIKLREIKRYGMIVLSGCKGRPAERHKMSIEQLNAWGAYYAAKAESEAKHGIVETWASQDKHPWNVSEKAKFEASISKA